MVSLAQYNRLQIIYARLFFKTAWFIHSVVVSLSLVDTLSTGVSDVKADIFS